MYHWRENEETLFFVIWFSRAFEFQSQLSVPSPLTPPHKRVSVYFTNTPEAHTNRGRSSGFVELNFLVGFLAFFPGCLSEP